MVLILILRYMLVLENRRRDAEEHDSKYDDVYIETASGSEKGRVDKAFLDLTDIQNRDFRYVL
jgi:hypothetical protein